MDSRGTFEKILDGLRTQAGEATFHRADAGPVAVCNSWSSAHYALALLPLDPRRAAAELQSVYRLCGLPDGLLALERVIDPELCAERAAALGEIYRPDGTSLVIGPPTAAYAAARVASALGAEARDLLETASAHLDAIWGERLPPDTPLPVILHPLEAGAYGSPIFDEVIESTDAREWIEETGTLVRSAAACRMDPDRALRAGHPFVVEDPIFCGWLLLALEAAARAWEGLGGAEAQVTKLRIRVEMIARGILDRLWWSGEEIFVAVDRARQRPLRAVTMGGLVPAACRSVIEEGEAKQAIDRHLRPGVSPLWGNRGVSFNPIARDVGLDLDQVRWRGNAISPLTHFWAHLALMNARRPADARAARTQIEDLVETAGSWEFYDAITGKGYGAGGEAGHGGSALALDMESREEAP